MERKRECYHEGRVAQAVDKEETGADDGALADVAAPRKPRHLEMKWMMEGDDQSAQRCEHDTRDLQPALLLHVQEERKDDGHDGLRRLLGSNKNWLNLPDGSNVGGSKGQSHEEGDLVAEHAKSNPKEADVVVLVNVVLFRKQLEGRGGIGAHANGNQDDSSEKLSIEGENERRHALEGLLADAVANAENDLDHDRAEADDPLGRRFYGKEA